MRRGSNDESSASNLSAPRTRYCGLCGKAEIYHWKRHWNTHHKDRQRFEVSQQDAEILRGQLAIQQPARAQPQQPPCLPSEMFLQEMIRQR